MKSLQIFNSKTKYLFKFKTATVETVAKYMQQKYVLYKVENAYIGILI